MNLAHQKLGAGGKFLLPPYTYLEHFFLLRKHLKKRVLVIIFELKLLNGSSIVSAIIGTVRTSLLSYVTLFYSRRWNPVYGLTETA